MDTLDDYLVDMSGGVYVTVANNMSLGINKNGDIVYFPTNNPRSDNIIRLGRATEGNIRSLIFALEHLKIHSVEIA